MDNLVLKSICYLLDKIDKLEKQVEALTLDNEMIQKNIDYHQAETDRLLKLISRE